MFKKILIITVITLGLTQPVWAEKISHKGTAEVSSIITAIDFRGNYITPDKEVTAVVFSRLGDALNEEKVKQDVKAVYSLGYFKDVGVTFEAWTGGTKIIFIIDENPILSGINIEGNTVYSDEQIITLMQNKAKKLLSYKTLQEDIKTIEAKYHSDGYTLARVVDVSTDEKNVLNLKVVEGAVESIALEGNDVTKDYVILRELKTKAGSVLNEKVLQKDLKRVFNLGFFSNISPRFEPATAPDKIILILKVEESRTSTVNFGGGYGEREGWFGFADLSINNLLGTGQGLLLRGQSGQQQTTYQLRYSHPWVFPEVLGEHAAFTLRRWYTYGTDVYFPERTGVYNGWDASLSKPFWDVYSATFQLGNERVSPLASGPTFESYTSDTLGLSFSYDTRDFWLNPTTGAFYTVSIRQGWKHTDTAVTGFTQYGLDLNQYLPLAEKQTLALHMGTGIGLGDVPLSEEYWAGGANTIRGYFPSDAKRGTKKLILNAEYRYTFNDMFQGVLFYDYGNAWDVGFPNPADFISGSGFGVRLQTPMGPIRLDYGISAGKTFGEGITHFSIGQAF
jgi:outer membrane protein insertion porin family